MGSSRIAVPETIRGAAAVAMVGRFAPMPRGWSSRIDGMTPVSGSTQPSRRVSTPVTVSAAIPDPTGRGAGPAQKGQSGRPITRCRVSVLAAGSRLSDAFPQQAGAGHVVAEGVEFASQQRFGDLGQVIEGRVRRVGRRRRTGGTDPPLRAQRADRPVATAQRSEAYALVRIEHEIDPAGARCGALLGDRVPPLRLGLDRDDDDQLVRVTFPVERRQTWVENGPGTPVSRRATGNVG